MKRFFSLFLVAFAMTAMFASCEKDNNTTNGNTPGGNTPGGNTNTTQTDTTIMNYTLMRSLLDSDWDEACGRVVAMGFTEIDPEELDADEDENVRAFIKGSLMGNYYACYLRCDFPEVDNLVGSVVMQEHHMGSSSQSVCLENLIYLVNDERSVLNDMDINPEDCGGVIIWNEITGTNQDGDQSYYPGHSAFEDFAAALRALEVHSSVNANWADNYSHNGSMYVATGSAVCVSNAYTSIIENIITLEKEDNLD